MQAFIIAFYAEMYGFPLTIYFLARFFGLDLEWGRGGNLWAQLTGNEAAHVIAMMIGYTIVFSGAGMVAVQDSVIRPTGKRITEGQVLEGLGRPIR